MFASASLLPVKGQSQASGQAEAQTQKKAQAPKASDPDSDSKRPPELLSLVGDVRLTFPEFSADMLITIAESEKVADKEWKKGKRSPAHLVEGPNRQHNMLW
ncbi:MAG: hypothetical protein L0229_19335 [Blastocatellia bacterium]|nr:hypothetical protein [Blastocatellia bacterium]